MNINKIPLFQRAKCALCGKTVLGNVVERLYDSEQFWFRTNTGKLTLVNVESVCNWTGKYHYNTQIFEGDVIEFTFELDGEWFCERFVVAYNKKYAAYCLFDKHGRFDEPGLDILNLEEVVRVVGNIYDNPELVEGWEDPEGDSL